MIFLVPVYDSCHGCQQPMHFLLCIYEEACWTGVYLCCLNSTFVAASVSSVRSMCHQKQYELEQAAPVYADHTEQTGCRGDSSSAARGRQGCAAVEVACKYLLSGPACMAKVFSTAISI